MGSNKKYEQVEKKAKELFWKYGVKRVSVEEICREAHVSKMTFYKHFNNKLELARIIVEKVIGDSIDEFRKLIDSTRSFEDKVQGIFHIKLNATKNISREFIDDLYKNPELGLHTIIEDFSKISMDVFVNFLNDSKSKGLIRQDVTVGFIVAYQQSILQMMENKELMETYGSTGEFILESMKFLFFGIMPANKNRNA